MCSRGPADWGFFGTCCRSHLNTRFQRCCPQTRNSLLIKLIKYVLVVQIWFSSRQQVVVAVGHTWGGAEVPPLLHLPVGELLWLSTPVFSFWWKFDQFLKMVKYINYKRVCIISDTNQWSIGTATNLCISIHQAWGASIKAKRRPTSTWYLVKWKLRTRSKMVLTNQGFKHKHCQGQKI